MNRVFNTSELLTMDLHNAAIKELGESLVTQLATPKEEMGMELEEGEDENTPYLDPIEQYDVAHALLEIFKYATYVTGVHAESYCETKNIGSDGGHFQHKNGVWHERQFILDYKYEDNDWEYVKDKKTGERKIDPETGKPKTKSLNYKVNKRKVKVTSDYLKQLKIDLEKSIKKIKEAHPDMEASLQRVTFKYHGYKEGPLVWGSKIQTAEVPKEEESAIVNS